MAFAVVSKPPVRRSAAVAATVMLLALQEKYQCRQKIDEEDSNRFIGKEKDPLL